MKIIKLLLITVLVITGLNAKKPAKRIITSQIGDNLYKTRVYTNYKNPYVSHLLIDKDEGNFNLTLPVADRLDILKLREFIKFSNAINVDSKISFISIKANNKYVKQFRIESIDGYKVVQADIPPSFLEDNYNDITVNIVQEAVKDVQPMKKKVQSSSLLKKGSGLMAGGFGESTVIDAPEVWTQIDTRSSYIDIFFRLKPFKEEVKSIYKFIFDNKLMVKDTVNLVFPKQPTENDLKNYSFFANVIGTILKFTDIDFTVSTSIKDKMNNIVIMNREDLQHLLKNLQDKNSTLANRLSGNINLVQNPNNIYKGILAITGDSQKEIFSALMRLADSDISAIDEQNIKVISEDLPQMSKAFTAPHFIQFDKKYLFSDLGIDTSTLLGSSSWILYSKFTLYPLLSLKNNYKSFMNRISYKLNYLLADAQQLKPIFNLYINKQFVSQSSGANTSFKTSVQSVGSSFSSSFLQNGENKFFLEITNYLRDSKSIFDNVAALTLTDDSYLILPKIHSEVEYPNLKYISNLGFPFSIYPDLQNTGILITDFNSNTIASAMQISFQLGKKLDTPAYRLTTTYDINKLLDKDIIVLGNQIKAYEILYKNAPIKIKGQSLIKEQDIKRGEKFISVRKETFQDMTDYLIAQTYKSPFNKKRIVFEILATNPKTLLKGTQDGLIPAKIGDFDGDVWFYNIKTEKSHSFRFKQKYLVHNIIDDYEINYLDEKYLDIDEF